MEEINESITAKFQEQTEIFKEKYDQQLELLNKVENFVKSDFQG